jgi:hypothetical protein
MLSPNFSKSKNPSLEGLTVLSKNEKNLYVCGKKSQNRKCFE